MNKSESIKNLGIALAKFQGDIKNPENTAINPAWKSKYAPLSEILNLVRPLLSKHGLSLFQMPINSENGVGVTTTLLHESGEWIETDPLILKLEKQNAQGAGSCITYARRYSLSAVLGISSEDDDDANSISQPKPQAQKGQYSPTQSNNGKISKEQIKKLYATANGRYDEAKTIQAKYGYESSKDIKVTDFQKILSEVSEIGKK
jgi:hypothetical protein